MNTLKISLLIIFSACLTFSCSSDDSPVKIDSKLIIGISIKPPFLLSE